MTHTCHVEVSLSVLLLFQSFAVEVTILFLTLSDTKTSVHSQSHEFMRLSPIDHGVIGPKAEPVVGIEGDHMMGEEEEETGAGQKHSDGFQIGPKHRQLDLREEKAAVSSSSHCTAHI